MATEFSQTISSTSGTLSRLEVNSTIFKFLRTSAENSLPVMSKLVISPVSNGLNGTMINCENLDTAEVSSTTVAVIVGDSCRGSLHSQCIITTGIFREGS